MSLASVEGQRAIIDRRALGDRIQALKAGKKLNREVT